MRPSIRPYLAVAAVIAAIALAVAGIAAAGGGARKGTTAPATRAASGPAAYRAAAETAWARSRRWWDPSRGWYRQSLHGKGPATMWGIVHLFQATSALAIADPTPARRAAVRAFARGAERYWNPALRPVPAYGPVPNNPGAHLRAWYDDEGWWGVAFIDAFRATGDRRYLGSAKRSLRFLDSGWDRRRGGIYWDNRRTFKASESLVTATLIAADLFRQTHAPRYLRLARKYIAWANTNIRAPDGLYGGRESPAGPMPYVEGPMAEAFMVLCRATGRQSYCTSAEDLATRTAERFPKLTMGPQYDAMYVRSLLELYRYDHDPRWYRIAAAEGDRALANAKGGGGLYLRTWDGRPISAIGTAPGKLQTHAATTSVLAWLAAARPSADH